MEFLKSFSLSPYALSLSFLKDPSIVGSTESEAKFSLNLDEETLEEYYKKLEEVE